MNENNPIYPDTTSKMSLRRWSTTLEQRQLHTSINQLLEGESALVDHMLHSSSSSSSSEMDSLNISRNSSITSSSSSSPSSSSSSSSSSDEDSTEDDSMEEQEELIIQLSLEVRTQASLCSHHFKIIHFIGEEVLLYRTCLSQIALKTAVCGRSI